MRIAAIIGALLLVLSPKARAAEHPCDAFEAGPGYQGCESALGASRFEEIIAQFDAYNDSLPTHADRVESIAPLFYKGSALYGLYLRERSPVLRCEYARRAQEILYAFQKRGIKLLAITPSSYLNGILMRQRLQSRTLGKLTSCELPGYTEAEANLVVDREVERVLGDILTDPLKRDASFAPALEAVKNVSSKTADVLAKIDNYAIEYAAIAAEIQDGDDHSAGVTTQRIRDIAGVSHLSKVTIDNDARQATLASLPSEDGLEAIHALAELKRVENGDDIRTKATHATALKAYVAHILAPSSSYAIAKQAIFDARAERIGIEARIDDQVRDVAAGLRAHAVFSAQCADAVKAFFCQEGL